MQTLKVENEFQHILFWDFEEIRDDIILELGEIDCLLRDKNGKIIDTTYVEPPYYHYIEENLVRFEFESVIEDGITYLHIPK